MEIKWPTDYSCYCLISSYDDFFSLEFLSLLWSFQEYIHFPYGNSLMLLGLQWLLSFRFFFSVSAWSYVDKQFECYTCMFFPSSLFWITYCDGLHWVKRVKHSHEVESICILCNPFTHPGHRCWFVCVMFSVVCGKWVDLCCISTFKYLLR